MLLDHHLRKQVIAANRANLSLKQANVYGSGHNYWVDRKAGFSIQDQSDLIQFLSLDDDPEVLPAPSPS